MKPNREDFYNFLLENGFQIDRVKAGIIFFKLFHKSNYINSLIFTGPPGTGKTYLTELIAKYFERVYGDCKYLFYQCTKGTDETDLLFKILPTPKGLQSYEGVLIKALKLSHAHKVVVVLDEFDKTRPTADAFLLDYIQNCRIFTPQTGEIRGNPNNIVLILTSNNFREISEPLLRRCAVITFSNLTPEQIYRVLSKKYNPVLVKYVVELYSYLIRSYKINKPITIQELDQFCNAVKYAKTVDDVVDMVLSYLIKPLEKLKMYKKQLSNYQYSILLKILECVNQSHNQLEIEFIPKLIKKLPDPDNFTIRDYLSVVATKEGEELLELFDDYLKSSGIISDSYFYILSVPMYFEEDFRDQIISSMSYSKEVSDEEKICVIKLMGNICEIFKHHIISESGELMKVDNKGNITKISNLWDAYLKFENGSFYLYINYPLTNNIIYKLTTKILDFGSCLNEYGGLRLYGEVVNIAMVYADKYKDHLRHVTFSRVLEMFINVEGKTRDDINRLIKEIYRKVNELDIGSQTIATEGMCVYIKRISENEYEIKNCSGDSVVYLTHITKQYNGETVHLYEIRGRVRNCYINSISNNKYLVNLSEYGIEKYMIEDILVWGDENDMG